MKYLCWILCLFLMSVGVGFGVNPVTEAKKLVKHIKQHSLTEQQVKDMNDVEYLTALEIPVVGVDTNTVLNLKHLIKGHAVNIAGIRVPTTANTPLRALMQDKETEIIKEADKDKKELIYTDKKLLLRAKVLLLVQQYFPNATLTVTDNDNFIITLPKTLPVKEISE